MKGPVDERAYVLLRGSHTRWEGTKAAGKFVRYRASDDADNPTIILLDSWQAETLAGRVEPVDGSQDGSEDA